jgi:hypothetical protein
MVLYKKVYTHNLWNSIVYENSYISNYRKRYLSARSAKIATKLSAQIHS